MRYSPPAMTAAPEAPANALVGAILSRRFRLVAPLGEGGMGVVYVAEPVAGGPRVAIKLLRPEFLDDPNVLDRFLEEANTSMRIQHPNVLRVFEAAKAEDGSPLIGVPGEEGLEGRGSLAARVARRSSASLSFG